MVFFYKDDFAIKYHVNVDMLLNKEIKSNQMMNRILKKIFNCEHLLFYC